MIPPTTTTHSAASAPPEILPVPTINITSSAPPSPTEKKESPLKGEAASGQIVPPAPKSQNDSARRTTLFRDAALGVKYVTRARSHSIGNTSDGGEKTVEEELKENPLTEEQLAQERERIENPLVLAAQNLTIKTIRHRRNSGNSPVEGDVDREALLQHLAQTPLSAKKREEYQDLLPSMEAVEAWKSFNLQNMKVQQIDQLPFVNTPAMQAPASDNYKWPVLTTSFQISKETGELSWAGHNSSGNFVNGLKNYFSRSAQDRNALSALFSELNKSPTFNAKMQDIAQSLPDVHQFEMDSTMGNQMDKLYNDFTKQFVIKEALIWKNADLAHSRQKSGQHNTANMVIEEDYDRLDLTAGGQSKGSSILFSALSGIEEEKSNWDNETNSNDYARMTEVIPQISIRVAEEKISGKGKAPVAPQTQQMQAALESIQSAIQEEIQTDLHKDFRALSAKDHIEYQGSIIPPKIKGLIGSLIGGGIYSTGMLMLNNHLNRGMIPEAKQQELGLDKQSTLTKLFSDVTDELLPIANKTQKFLMTFNPSWQFSAWEVADNTILDKVLGDDDDDEADEAGSVHSENASSENEEIDDDEADEAGSVHSENASSENEEIVRSWQTKVWDVLKSAPSATVDFAADMGKSAAFAVPAGAISGVFAWPDKAIEIWKPQNPAVALFRDGLKVGVTSPMESWAGSSGFFLKLGELKSEIEASIIKGLKTRKFAWPKKNPFDSSKPFDRSDVSQIQRYVHDKAQQQMNNDPNALAMRMSVPWEFMAGVVQGGISLIPGMTPGISFALDTLFFGPGEMIWMNITGAFSNRANERQLREKFANLQKRCEENHASPAETRWAITKFLLENKVVSEESLSQWMDHKTSMLGGMLAQHIFEATGTLKNYGRIGMNGLIGLPGQGLALLPENVKKTGKQVGNQIKDTSGEWAGRSVDFSVAKGFDAINGIMKHFQDDYTPDPEAPTRVSESIKNSLMSTASAIAGIVTPDENNMRLTPRLPWSMLVQPKATETTATVTAEGIELPVRRSVDERMADILNNQRGIRV